MLVEKRWWTSASADSVSGFAQVVVEAADLAGEQQALVDHRAGREATACRAGVRPGRLCLRPPAAASGFWICLRMASSLRSKASWSCDVRAAADEAWRITGIAASTASPRPVVSVGTSRQPSSGWPSSAMKCSNCCDGEGARARRPAAGSTWPRRIRRAAAGSRPLASRPVAQQARRGSGSGMPAPSPTSGSAPTAPRWSRLSRICRPWRDRSSCDLRPLMLATKPTPQASCSFRGSYRPCFSGSPIRLLFGQWRVQARGGRRAGVDRLRGTVVDTIGNAAVRPYQMPGRCHSPPVDRAADARPGRGMPGSFRRALQIGPGQAGPHAASSPVPP